jgi:NtrC-family two-component system response regulator AlgB
MVTGYASIDTAVEAIQRGASDYVAKPFTPEELVGAANKALRGAVV